MIESTPATRRRFRPETFIATCMLTPWGFPWLLRFRNIHGMETPDGSFWHWSVIVGPLSMSVAFYRR